MSFDEFVTEMKQRVSEKLGNQFQITTTESMEENGVNEIRLSALYENESLYQDIRMRPYYNAWFQDPDFKDSLDNIAEGIAHFLVKKASSTPDKQEMHYKLFDFAWARNHLVFRILRTEWNETLLQNRPHIPFLDFSIIFYVELDGENGKFTKAVDHSLADVWSVSVQELYEEALKNTPHKRPALFKNLYAEILEIYKGDAPLFLLQAMQESDELKKYLLTNEDKHHGAAVMLYPGVLKQCAETLGGDLMIIPSSVHELILMQANERVKSMPLTDVIMGINETDVAEDEILSDHPYLYLLDQDKVISFGVSDRRESEGQYGTDGSI